MNEPNLEKIMMVTLYKVNESGHKILCDSPRNGMEQEYGHWSDSHGPYTNENDAKAKKTEVMKKISEMRRTANVECNVEIKTLFIPESELVIRNGEYYRIKSYEKL